MLGPASTEVAWQQLRDGSVCVVAGLAADDTGDVYTLQSGAKTTATQSNPTSLLVTSDYIQIDNGTTGARIPTPLAQSSASTPYSLAPIQQILVANTWVGDSPKLLNGDLNQNGDFPPVGPISFCNAYNQSIEESGPIQITVSIGLICNRPAYSYGSTEVSPAGLGIFNAEVSVYSGSNSVVFSYLTDLDAVWNLDVSDAYATTPNLLAWRGHGSNSTECGYYIFEGERFSYRPDLVESQGLTDLSYGARKEPNTYGPCADRNISMIFNYSAGAGNNMSFAQWLLNDTQGGLYPVLGLWTGAGSKQQYYIHPVGYTTDTSGIFITHHIYLRGPDNSIHPYNGGEFGYFVATQADMPNKYQYTVRPAVILKDMNGLRGPVKLTTLYKDTLSYANPIGGWEWPFLPEATMTARINKLNTDGSYYGDLVASAVGPEGTYFLNWAHLQDDTSRAALLTSSTEIKSAIDKWSLGNGRFDQYFHYYQGVYPFIRAVDNYHAIIKDSSASAAQVAQAKTWLGLAVSLANNLDYFNYGSGGCPDGCGNSNQVYQFVNYRDVLALVMSFNPSVTQEILKRAIDDTSSLLTSFWNSTGAGVASTHYQSNYQEPAIALLLASIKKGLISSSAPQANLCNSISWDLSSLTTLEPRFTNNRKSYSNGDGNTEANPRLGLSATGCSVSEPSLSENALWGWRSLDPANRYTHGSFYFPTVSLIDDQITQTDPNIGSLYKTGYHAALRANWGSVNETAAWFIHGDWYSDHKHRDNGQVSIYAHNAPLTVDYNANLYNPQTAGGYMHSRAVRELELTDAWDGAMTSYSTPDNEWGSPSSVEFGKFHYGSFSKSTFGATWARDVRMLSHSTSYPVIIIRDTFSGSDAATSKIISSTHMANNVVTVNGATVTATERSYGLGQFPSCTAGDSLLSGLNRFQFIGQDWVLHPTGGIDWDTYINISGSNSFCIGNWQHHSQDARGMAEYLAANGVPFTEKQDLLRVKTSGSSMETIILPWRKGESATFTVTNEACGTQIVRGTHTTCSSADMVTWTDGTDSSLMAVGTTGGTYAGMTITGGPGEIRTSSTNYIATIDGLSAQNRTITLPAGSWYPNGPAVTVASNQFRLFHDGTTGQPRAVTFSGTASGGSLPLGFSPPSGGEYVRVYIDNVAVAQEACSATCSFELQLPSGTFTIKHAWVNSGGSVFLTSTERSITI